MPSKSVPLFPKQAQLLRDLGERLRAARLRRRFSVELVAQRCGVSRPTLNSVEKGDPSVTLGVYLRVLGVLNMDRDLEHVAALDPVGQRIQDAALSKPRRLRAPKQVVLQDHGPAPGVPAAADDWSVGGMERVGLPRASND